MNRPGPASIGTSLMFEPLKVNSKGFVELCHPTRENHGPTRGVFLHYRKAMRTGEFFNGLNIASFSPESLREILAFDVLRSVFGALKFLDVIIQRIGRAMSE